MLLHINNNIGCPLAGEGAILFRVVDLVGSFLSRVAQHPHLVDGIGRRAEHFAHRIQHREALLAQHGAVSVEKHGLVEGDEHLAVAPGDGDLTLRPLLRGDVFLQLLVKVVDLRVHLRLIHLQHALALLGVGAGAVAAQRCRGRFHRIGVEAHHDGLIFFLADGGHGIEQHEKAKQERHHVAIGVHPVCAATAAL